jgi:hypothetical protein
MKRLLVILFALGSLCAVANTSSGKDLIKVLQSPEIEVFLEETQLSESTYLHVNGIRSLGVEVENRTLIYLYNLQFQVREKQKGNIIEDKCVVLVERHVPMLTQEQAVAGLALEEKILVRKKLRCH